MGKIKYFSVFLIFLIKVLTASIFPEYPDLKLFGLEFFENYIPTFKTLKLPISDDYIIGPGDLIIINVWGFWEEDLQKEVEIDGSIFISGIGKVYVAGRKLGEVKKIISDKFYKKYKNINVSVSCGKMRTISVFILGEVKKPGMYEILPLFNIIDILSMAGGITVNGSLRQIEIIHHNGEKELIDIYPLILKGEKIKIFQFQEGDIIFVHPAKDIVGIVGPVKRPAIYELKEMKIKEIIELSGGFLPNADMSYIQIERIDKEKGKILIEVKNEEFDNFQLKNYDVLKVPVLSSYSFYQVYITGAVKVPKIYGWREGMKISDVLKKEDLLPFAEKEVGEVIRIKEGFREIIKFSPEKVFSGIASEDFYLLPQDKIVIYSKEKPEKKVVIQGEVKFPGEYIIGSGEKLSSIIKRAGGFSPFAYPKGIIFLRESIKKQKEEEIEKFVKEKRNLLETILKTSTEEEKQLIEKAMISLEKIASLKPSGRIVIKMENFEKFENGLYDIPLEDGDIIYIPKKPVYVSVFGEVNNPANILYDENLTIKDYISKTGGFTKDADKKNIFIVRVDGTSDRNFEKIEPGDTIVVPFEPKERTPKVVRDIVQMFYQIAVGVGVLIK
ncbi:MAG: SLBB domain-containing protein [Candidatus Omnitrophica bacterium]|nr:SLBB domain-containing protein [Candidatus Omnitrophota bacterium]